MQSIGRFDERGKRLLVNAREDSLLSQQMQGAIPQVDMTLLGRTRVEGVPTHLEHGGHSKYFPLELVIHECGTLFALGYCVRHLGKVMA